VCPLLVEFSGVVRAVEKSPIWRTYPEELRCVLNDEDRFMFILSMSYEMYWLLSLVVLCAKLISFGSAVVDFSLLIVVLNIDVQ